MNQIYFQAYMRVANDEAQLSNWRKELLYMKAKIQKCLGNAILFVFLFVQIGCKKTATEPEGYRVTGYDAGTHQWTIIRNGTFDGKYLRKRLIVVCSFYQWGNHEMVKGKDACHLTVGRLYALNQMPVQGKEQDFLDVYEMPTETLAIAEGAGDDRVEQQFNIVKYEVLDNGVSK